MSRPEKLYGYSKVIDENRDKYDGMPCQAAFDVLAGVGANPEERLKGQEALWQKIEDGVDIPEERVAWLEEVQEKYPIDCATELDMQQNEQEVIAHLLDDVQMFRGDSQFVAELVRIALSETEMLSDTQEAWLRACCYKYRDQIRQNVTVKGVVDAEISGYIDDPFEFLEEIVMDCKPHYQEKIGGLEQ